MVMTVLMISDTDGAAASPLVLLLLLLLLPRLLLLLLLLVHAGEVVLAQMPVGNRATTEIARRRWRGGRQPWHVQTADPLARHP